MYRSNKFTIVLVMLLILPSVFADISIKEVGSNQIGFYTNGVQRGLLDASGNFNVSGTIKQGTTNVCMQDGTNCPAASVSYQSSAGGWTNDSTTTSTTLNVSLTGNLTIGTGTSNQSLLFIRATPGTGSDVVNFGNPQMNNQFIIRDRSYTSMMYGARIGTINMGQSGADATLSWTNQVANQLNIANNVTLQSNYDLVLGAGNLERVRILNSGSVGVGTAGPAAKLHVQDGAILANGTTGSTPTSGAGTRFMWIPAKAALRAGRVTGTEWNDASIGMDSIALGRAATASGVGSLAINGGTASGTDAVAIGNNSLANANHAVAIGGSPSMFTNPTYATAPGSFAAIRATASGNESIAMGYGADATGYRSIALGQDSQASQDYAVGVGVSARGLGWGAIALGYSAYASGLVASSLGYDSQASGNFSTAIGSNIQATNSSSFVIGSGIFPSLYLTNNIPYSLMIGFNSTTPTMFINGSAVGIGTTVPSGRLEVAEEAFVTPVIVRQYINNSGAGAGIVTGFARGSFANPLTPVAEDRLGYLVVGGNTVNGTATWVNSAGISVYAEENFRAGAGGANLRFETVNTGSAVRTEKMRITANGNVGIGTTTPNTSLHISSANNPNAAGWPSLTVGGDANKERIRIESTSAAVYQAFQSRGTAASPTAIQSGDYTGYYQLGGYNGTTWLRSAWIAGIATENWAGNSQGGALQFATVANNTGGAMTERMRIDHNGNVGIGTTSPSALLEVNGSSNSILNGIVRIQNTYSNTYVPGLEVLAPNLSDAQQVYIGLGQNASTYNRAAWAFNRVSDGNVSNYMSFGFFGANNLLTVKASGKVGVGTADPNATLDVRGSIKAGTSPMTVFDNSPTILLTNETAATYIAASQNSSLGIQMAWIANSDASLTYGRITTHAHARPVMIGNNWAYFLSTGVVGIGTSSPDNGKLEVKGGTVCVDTNSDDSATSCIASESDERLKRNITQINGALAKIRQLRGVTFDWRVDDPEVLSHYPLIARFNDSPHSIGLIAQEVAPVLPEAIMLETVGDNQTQYLQLDYDKITPVLVEGIKEQQAQIEAQDAAQQALAERVSTLESQNAQLRSELDDLKAAVQQLQASATG